MLVARIEAGERADVLILSQAGIIRYTSKEKFYRVRL